MSTELFQSATGTNLTHLSAQDTLLDSVWLWAPSLDDIAPPPNLLQLGYFALFNGADAPVLNTTVPLFSFQFTLQSTEETWWFFKSPIRFTGGLWFSCTFKGTEFPPNPLTDNYYNPLIGGNVKAVINYR